MRSVKKNRRIGMTMLFTIAARGKPIGDAKMVSRNAKIRKIKQHAKKRLKLILIQR